MPWCPKPADTEKWVEIHQTSGQAEACIVKGRLESEGIPTLVEQEAIGKCYGFQADGLGRVRILVPETCEQQAREALVVNEETNEE